MALYIIAEDERIIEYGKNGSIQIQYWPILGGSPARKDLCKWNGENVILKNQEELDIEEAEKILNTIDVEYIQTIDFIIDTLIDKDILKNNDIPKLLMDKYEKRKKLRNKKNEF